jgi:hypothetical protein
MPLDVTIYISAILVSCLSGLTIYFQQKPAFYQRLFSIFLFITLSVELYAFYLAKHRQHNVGVYNLYNLVSTCFYLYVLHEVIQSKVIKKIIIWANVLFLLFAIWNLIFWQKMENFNNITCALASLIIVAFCITYFIEIFQRPMAINLLAEPSFWICGGLIFFNTCSLPYFGLVHMLENLPLSLFNRIFEALNILNILLYIIFSVSFLCRLRIRKSI